MRLDKPIGDHLLIGKAQYEKLSRENDGAVYAQKTHILVSERTEENAKGSIYKYQSAKEILKKLTGVCTQPELLTGDVLVTDRKIRLKEEILKRLSRQRDESEEEVCRVIDACLLRENQQHPMRMEEQNLLRRELFHAIKGLDVIQDLLDDPEITEIMINGPDHIFIEKAGRLYESSKTFDSKERLLDIIHRVAAGANRSINLASPIVDARLEDGSRVNAVLDPVAINGPVMTIRRFGKSPITAQKLIELGSVTEECLADLNTLVCSGYNILISGGTGAGKTTILNVLSSFIPKDERIITIEDSAELKLHGITNLVRFEARMETPDGVKAITIRNLIKTALRCRPDRVIVGEVRSEEAIDMLQALNIGQDGSMSTIHANSASDALYRLETIIMLSSDIPLKALRRQIASGIDIIVHLGRLRDKSRRLLEILEVTGMEESEINTHPLYVFEETGEENGRVLGELVKKGKLIHRYKLKRAGLDHEL
ncbi:MAG: CpaF family protein [Lachnospiraceae bacterium]|nr:CpaF family protein [Lachnospiraceae bacterium]